MPVSHPFTIVKRKKKMTEGQTQRDIAREKTAARLRRFRQKNAEASVSRVEVKIFDTPQNRDKLREFVKGLQE